MVISELLQTTIQRFVDRLSWNIMHSLFNVSMILRDEDDAVPSFHDVIQVNYTKLMHLESYVCTYSPKNYRQLINDYQMQALESVSIRIEKDIKELRLYKDEGFIPTKSKQEHYDEQAALYRGALMKQQRHSDMRKVAHEAADRLLK